MVGGGAVSERGGTFVGPTQDHVLALAHELGIGTFDTYDTGDNVYVSGGQRSTYSDTGATGTAPLDPVILADLALVVSELDQMSTQVPVGAPWESPNAGSWDGQTLETWIDAHSVTPQFRHLVPAATRPIFGCEPRDLSLLYVLFYIASSGNETNPGTFRLVESGCNREQPTAAVVVGQRNSGRHARDVLRGMQVITVHELHAELARE